MSETIEQIKARVKQAQKNYSSNIKAIDKVLIAERGQVSRIPKNEDIVVLMSGGLDSVVMVQKVIDDWNVKVHPIFIKRGAKAEKYEEASFDYFAEFYAGRFPNNFFQSMKLEYEIPPRSLKDNFPTTLTKTVGHPLRNSTMQNLAVMYAVSLQTSGIEAKTVLSGSVAEDNTEPELGLLSLRAQTLATCIEMGDWKWNITSPLTDPYLTQKLITKTDLIEYAIQKFIPLEKTRTCFSENEFADGTCHACIKRLEAFQRAGYTDKTKYLLGETK